MLTHLEILHQSIIVFKTVSSAQIWEPLELWKYPTIDYFWDSDEELIASYLQWYLQESCLHLWCRFQDSNKSLKIRAVIPSQTYAIYCISVSGDSNMRAFYYQMWQRVFIYFLLKTLQGIFRLWYYGLVQCWSKLADLGPKWCLKNWNDPIWIGLREIELVKL